MKALRKLLTSADCAESDINEISDNTTFIGRTRRGDGGFDDDTMTGTSMRSLKKKSWQRMSRRPFYGQVIQPSQFFANVSMTSFTLVVFFRGSWCGVSNYYLENVNEVIGRVTSLGGNIVAVCSQDEVTVDHLIKQCNLQFSICSDVKNEIANLYNMTITQRDSEQYGAIVADVNDQRRELLTSDSCNKYGFVQPGILILDGAGTVLYKWTSTILKRNGYGKQCWILLDTVLDTMNFMFNPDYPEIPQLNIEKSEFIDKLLEHPLARLRFITHVEAEQNIDLLQFYEGFRNAKLNNDPGQLTDLYSIYLKKHAEKEIGVPKLLLETLDSTESVGTSDVSAFTPVSDYVRQLLVDGSLTRFLQSTAIVDVVNLMPEYFD